MCTISKFSSIPGKKNEPNLIHSGDEWYFTLHSEACKVSLKIMDSGKKNLDEFFSHVDCLKIVPIADTPKHIRYACCTRLLEGQQNSDRVSIDLQGGEKKYTCPNAINLLFHFELYLL